MVPLPRLSTVAGILMKHITEPAPLLHEKDRDIQKGSEDERRAAVK